jgi:hypothetical protein
VAEVSVLETVSKPLIEAAYGTHMISPGRRISSPPARLARDAAVHDFADYWKVPGQQPPPLVDVEPP